MTAGEFRAWRSRFRLTRDQAAWLLGRRRSMIYAYEAGTAPIPETVARLCDCLAANPAHIGELLANLPASAAPRNNPTLSFRRRRASQGWRG